MSNKPGHREEHEGNRKTIARGMPGDFRCDRGDYARVLTSLIAREASGALGARHSLRPLNSPGQDFKAKLARKARRDREAVFEQGGTKTLVMPGLDPRIHHSSEGFIRSTMDCRVKCSDRRDHRRVFGDIADTS